MGQKLFNLSSGDTIRAVVITDTTGTAQVFSAGAPGFVSAAGTDLVVGAAVGAAGANNQTLAGVASKTTFISGFHVDGLGATGATNISVTITGLTNTLTYNLAIPAGVAVALTRLQIEFTRPIPASAVNTAIVVNVPTFGAGNTLSMAGAHGFQL